MKCTSCGKYPFCKNINENGCDEWIKQKYVERKLVKVDGLRYEFEEVN